MSASKRSGSGSVLPPVILFDIGASLGCKTTKGSQLVGNTGKVFAFEPSPLAIKIIEGAVA